MVKKQPSISLENFLRLSVILLPVIFILFGAYFLYYGVYQRNKINKTIDDIITINNSIQSKYNGIYKNFNLETIILSDILPFDMEIQKNGNKSFLKNRFGGYVFFYEGFNTENERTLFYSLMDEQNKYQELYTGVTSYIILYTGLSKRECLRFSQIDWKEILPNFIGMEASFLTPQTKYNGLYNLKTSLLSDVDEELRQSQDMGIVSSCAMSKSEAMQACGCGGDECTFALKLR